MDCINYFIRIWKNSRGPDSSVLRRSQKLLFCTKPNESKLLSLIITNLKLHLNLISSITDRAYCENFNKNEKVRKVQGRIETDSKVTLY